MNEKILNFNLELSSVRISKKNKKLLAHKIGTLEIC